MRKNNGNGKSFIMFLFVVLVISFIIIYLICYSPLKKNDYIWFGSYEQDNDLSNGSEPIKWQVLSVNSTEAVLLCTDIIDIVPFSYDNSNSSMIWETSFIRDWLNKDFYESAFSEEEISCIKSIVIKNTPNPVDGLQYNPKENNTEDKVYLLSFDELEEYGLCERIILKDFESYEERYDSLMYDNLEARNKDIKRRCVVSEYVLNKMSYIDIYADHTTENRKSYPWFLRSKGLGDKMVGGIESNGSISFVGFNGYAGFGIRPVIRINLSNGKYKIISKKLEKSSHVTANKPESQIAIVINPENYESYKNLEKGNYVLFGNYEQNNIISDGQEPVEWVVLNKTDNELLLLSKYIIDNQAFNTTDADVTWENCTLRSWLNTNFYNSVFNDKEKSIIKKCKITNDITPEYKDDRYETYDNVFILSLEDLENQAYGFSSDLSYRDINRRCTATEYCKKMIKIYNDESSTSFLGEKENYTLEGEIFDYGLTRKGELSYSFLLRSREKTYQYNQIILSGKYGDKMVSSIIENNGVRPAICIKLDK